MIIIIKKLVDLDRNSKTLNPHLTEILGCLSPRENNGIDYFLDYFSEIP